MYQWKPHQYKSYGRRKEKPALNRLPALAIAIHLAAVQRGVSSTTASLSAHSIPLPLYLTNAFLDEHHENTPI